MEERREERKKGRQAGRKEDEGKEGSKGSEERSFMICLGRTKGRKEGREERKRPSTTRSPPPCRPVGMEYAAPGARSFIVCLRKEGSGRKKGRKDVED